MDTATQLRTELHARRGDWPTLCSATGLSYWWLTKFAQGRITEPGLSKIEKLQRYFVEHPIERPSEGPSEVHRHPAADEGDAAEAAPVAASVDREAA